MKRKGGHLDPRVYTKKVCKSSNFLVYLSAANFCLMKVHFQAIIRADPKSMEDDGVQAFNVRVDEACRRVPLGLISARDEREQNL